MKPEIIRFSAILLVLFTLLSVAACNGKTEHEDLLQDEPQIVKNGLQTVHGEVLVSTTGLAFELREAFADKQNVEYQESLWDVSVNQEFFVDFEFDILRDTEYRHIPDIFAVYADADLTESLWADWDIINHNIDPSIPEGHNRLSIRPAGSVPIGRVFGRYFDLGTFDVVELDDSGELFLHEGEWGDTWGYLRHFYLALHVDPVTSELLEKPLVTIFTLENRLDAPKSQFFVTEDGLGAFRWDAVEGADYYLIVRIDAEFTLESVMWPVGETTDTTWIHPQWLVMNHYFSTSSEEEDVSEKPSKNRSVSNFTVIAVNSETHSPMGTIHNGAAIAACLTHSPAYDLIIDESEEEPSIFSYVSDISLLPMQRPLFMANGVITYRRMIYDLDNIHFFGYIGYEDELNLELSYLIEGTTYNFKVIVEDINPDTYQAELDELRQKLEDFELRAGGSLSIDLTEREPEEGSPTVDDAPRDIITHTGDIIYANTALSAFLAHNMLAANELIDLTEFPENANWEYLVDAFFEAIYQNPLILHVAGAGSIPGTNIMVVEYKESQDTILRQQDAIRRVVPEIVAEIITEGMTDLEKSIAINEYIIGTAVYDRAALENAEKNNFLYVDAVFNDSFTAYGILINRVGVCAGYAAAFKLLADAAGLESIVVTGFLEGFLPHAWNRVNINGHWHTVDVTNNDNEFLANLFLHLPDDVAERVLVEDGKFVQNAFFGNHSSNDSSDEYYRVTGRFFERKAISYELAALIRDTGSAMLRTDFDLDDDSFSEIMQEVARLSNIDVIYGFHWLGAIFLTDGR